MVLISKACDKWCWSTHTFEEQNCYALQRINLQFPAQMTSDAENVSIWWRHHDDCVWYLLNRWCHWNAERVRQKSRSTSSFDSLWKHISTFFWACAFNIKRRSFRHFRHSSQGTTSSLVSLFLSRHIILACMGHGTSGYRAGCVQKTGGKPMTTPGVHKRNWILQWRDIFQWTPLIFISGIRNPYQAW